MRERSALLVSNTTPLIALAAATGSLDVLKVLYACVVVPLEVAAEICSLHWLRGIEYGN